MQVAKLVLKSTLHTNSSAALDSGSAFASDPRCRVPGASFIIFFILLANVNAFTWHCHSDLPTLTIQFCKGEQFRWCRRGKPMATVALSVLKVHWDNSGFVNNSDVEPSYSHHIILYIDIRKIDVCVSARNARHVQCYPSNNTLIIDANVQDWSPQHQQYFFLL